MEKKDFGLYTYKYNAFNIDSSDDETLNTADTSLFDSFTSKKRTRPQKKRNGATQAPNNQPKTEVIEVSDEDDDFIQKHRSRTTVEEDESMIRTSSIESAKRISQSLQHKKTSPLSADASTLAAAAHDTLQQHLRRAREYYERFRNIDTVVHVSEPHPSPAGLQRDVPLVSIPHVKTAAERAEERRRRVDTSLAVDLTSNDNGPAIEQPVAAPEQRIRLKTRLNGQHEWFWKPNRTDSFLKLKEKFAEIYGLPINAFTMRFENEVLGEHDSPEGLDLEDDDLIEVKLAAGQDYNAAIASANTYKARSSAPAADKAPIAESTAPSQRTVQVVVPANISNSGQLVEIIVKVNGTTTIERILRGIKPQTKLPEGHRLCASLVDREAGNVAEPSVGEELSHDATVQSLDGADIANKALVVFVRDSIDVFITLSFAENNTGDHLIIKVILKRHNTWQQTINSIVRQCQLDDEVLRLQVGDTILDPEQTVGAYAIVTQGCDIVCSIVE